MNNIRRYVGIIRRVEGRNGAFDKIQFDNPLKERMNKDTNVVELDPYWKGTLVWCDAKTGKQYKVKQLGLGGVNDASRGRGAVSSIFIDLDDSYHVENPEPKPQATSNAGSGVDYSSNVPSNTISDDDIPF